MSSSIPLSGAGKPSRAASAVVARKAQGFQVFRIDSYSVTTELISGGERITSEPFIVGGRCWRVDYYPNGTDGSKDDDSDAIAVYLRLEGAGHIKTERVRADYKFSLLDLAGNAAYELPKETATFTAVAKSEKNLGGAEKKKCHNDMAPLRHLTKDKYNSLK
ncbi:BTB/POZ and MATH domain-containing protein 1-like [Panicum virgatum]|uniref:BTB/POZ and MATH domain-containing protein 1-like n=1 Tax=Panicum virgatum TaxID=38727 RepID=UPI0019D5F0C1|nr:BTB/POZ and MATH domain-containing protein 1-like [Panicum virgatum]